VLYGGTVLTFDERERVVEAVALRGDRILAVGSDREMRALAGDSTLLVDLGGRLVLPGLVDAHTHSTGVDPDYLDLTAARSVAEIRAAVAQAVAARAPGGWIVGAGPFTFWRGWDERRLAERRLLNRHDLDPVSPDNPVLLIKDAGHALVLNSRALELAQITAATPDPRGQIEKDPATGEPTGILLESAMGLATSRLPFASEEVTFAAMRRASDQLLAFGTTTASNMSLYPQTVRAYQRLYRTSAGPLVTTVMNPLVETASGADAAIAAIERWPVATGFGDQDLKLGALKIFVDGGITGRAAWWSAPYKDRPGYFGIPQVERDVLFAIAERADRLGWQLHLHACGDAAAELALEALEAAALKNGTRSRRHIITHLYLLSDDQIARLRRAEVVAVLQPNFVYSLGEHLRDALDPVALARIVPFRSLLDAGVRVALSADGLPQNPWIGIWAAVARRTEEGNLLAPSEAVTVMEALRAYTRGSAYALFEEDRRGSLEPGKVADLIVLDRDLRNTPVAELAGVEVLMTIKNGRVVFDRLPSRAHP
jgi:predicted amidohydrolase YtcJ